MWQIWSRDWVQAQISPRRKFYTAADLKSRLKCPDRHALLLDSLLWLQSSEVAASDTQKTLGGARQTRTRRVSRQWPTLGGNGRNCPSPAWKTCHPGNECGGFHSMSQMRGWKLGCGNMSEPNCPISDWRHLKWRWESQHRPSDGEYLERRIAALIANFFCNPAANIGAMFWTGRLWPSRCLRRSQCTLWHVPMEQPP